MICDNGLLSPLFSSFYLLFLAHYPIFLFFLTPISSPPLLSYTTFVEEGQNVFQMTFSWQVDHPLISLTLSICLATSRTKEEVNLSSTSVFLFCLPVRKHPAPISQEPLLYIIHLSFLPNSIWLSLLPSAFQWHDPHLKVGWHVVECDMKIPESRVELIGKHSWSMLQLLIQLH